MRRSGIWILAGVLLSCSINVFAAEEVPDDAEVISGDEGAEAVAGMNEGEDVLYNVSFPTDIHAYLDPGNLSGRGQIFSDSYAIENYGNTDIVVKISNVDVHYISTEDVYEFSEEEVTDQHSSVKKLNVNMVWENESEQMERELCISEGLSEEYVLFLAASEYDENGEYVGLREGSAGHFYFTGTLNSNKNLVWEDGEVTIRFHYEIIPMESGKAREAIEGNFEPEAEMINEEEEGEASDDTDSEADEALEQPKQEPAAENPPDDTETGEEALKPPAELTDAQTEEGEPGREETETPERGEAEMPGSGEPEGEETKKEQQPTDDTGDQKPEKGAVTEAP